MSEANAITLATFFFLARALAEISASDHSE
jgi:hypothetical protein